jgi:hypothetical protein
VRYEWFNKGISSAQSIPTALVFLPKRALIPALSCFHQLYSTVEDAGYKILDI